MMVAIVDGRTEHKKYKQKIVERLLAFRVQENSLKTIGERNMKCIVEVKLVKQCSDINVWVNPRNAGVSGRTRRAGGG